MAKITVHSKVFWDAGGRKMEGKVKQILSDHAVVSADGTDYLVRKASLTSAKSLRTASSNGRTIIASSDDLMN